MDDLDVFGDDGREDGSLAREGQARETLFRSHGYRDGITAGKNDSAQSGFNAGFEEAAKASYRWGQARGVASAFASLPSALSSSLVSSDELKERIVLLDAEIKAISSQEAAQSFYTAKVQRNPYINGAHQNPNPNLGPPEVLHIEDSINSLNGAPSLAAAAGYTQSEPLLANPNCQEEKCSCGDSSITESVTDAIGNPETLQFLESIETQNGTVGSHMKECCGGTRSADCHCHTEREEFRVSEGGEGVGGRGRSRGREGELGERLDSKVEVLLTCLEGSNVSLFEAAELPQR